MQPKKTVHYRAIKASILTVYWEGQWEADVPLGFFRETPFLAFETSTSNDSCNQA